MFYVILTEWCKDRGMEPWEFLDMTPQSWCRIKKQDAITLKHLKRVCGEIGKPIIDDKRKLSRLLLEDYHERKEV